MGPLAVRWNPVLLHMLCRVSALTLTSRCLRAQFWYGNVPTPPLQQAFMLAAGFLPGLLFVYLALRKSPFLLRWRSAYHSLLRWSRFLVFFLYPALYRQYFFVSLTISPTIGALVSHILRLVGAALAHQTPSCPSSPRTGV